MDARFVIAPWMAGFLEPENRLAMFGRLVIHMCWNVMSMHRVPFGCDAKGFGR